MDATLARVSDHPRGRANGGSLLQVEDAVLAICVDLGRSRSIEETRVPTRQAAGEGCLRSLSVSSKLALTKGPGIAMPLRKLLIASCALLLALTASAQDKPAVPTTTYLLKADRVFDARSEATHSGWAVLVEGGTIAAVGPADQIHAPADAQVINLPGTTLLPGLIDAHSHIFLHPYNETLWNDQVLKEPLPYRTIEAVNHVRDTLMAGFTALRDLGTEGAGYADVQVQKAIDDGLIP